MEGASTSTFDKKIERLKSCPKDYTYAELTSVSKSLGYNEMTKGATSGSRVAFIDSQKNIIQLHKPHPGNIVKMYQLRQVIDTLTERGLLNE